MTDLKKQLIVFLLAVGFFISFGLNAQKSPIDSLIQLLSSAKHDSTILRLNVLLSNECNEVDIPKYAQTAVNLAQKLLLSKDLDAVTRNLYFDHLASAYNDLGFYNRLTGNSKLAIDYYNKTLDIRRQCNDSAGMVHVLNNLGAVYYKLGDVKKALNYYNSCLIIEQRNNNKTNEALTLSSIGIIYNEQLGEHRKSLQYLLKSLNISKSLKDARSEARTVLHIGAIYRSLGLYDSSIYFFRKCVSIQQSIGDNDHASNALAAIANLYYRNKNTDSAITIYNKALVLTEKLGEKQGTASICGALSNVYFDLKDYKTSEKYALKSFQISLALGYPKDVRNASELLYKLYKQRNNFKEALQMHELFEKMRDSVINIETKTESIKSELKYQFNVKTIADSLKNEHEQNVNRTKIALQKAELKQQTILRYVLLIGLVCVGLFVIFYYRRYKLSEQQKNIITEQQVTTQKQKKEIEYKNNLITQSIDYSKRIQDAFIQSEDVISLSGKEYFLFNQPKDIVSGDFLWAKKITNGLLFAVADCTGHGVPGAFMSLVSYNLLEQASKTVDNSQPHLILNEVNINLKKALKVKEGASSYEGMDIILCQLNLTTNNLTYAGTKHRLCISRNNVINEYRTENIIIGTEIHKSFKPHQILLEKNDIIYLFSDGYPDQKGGEKRLKLYYEPFMNLLKTEDNLSLSKKKEFLTNYMSSWKKNEDQIDDMLIFGLRI